MEMDEIERRLDRADAAACLALGRTKALEYAVRMLITTHPNPSAFERAWQALLPLIADAHIEPSPAIPDASMYQAGMQQILSVLTAQAAAGMQHPRPQD